MSKIKYTFVVVVEHDVTDEDLKYTGEILELGRPATLEEYRESEHGLMKDDGPEFLDSWMMDGTFKCETEIV
jgi:hypothetical protein